jgi:K+-transporting ATPase c subunit
MWNEQFTSMLMLVLMASLVRASYELSRQRPSGATKSDHQAISGGSNLSAATNPERTELVPRQKEWAEKAVRRYAESQEKKWRRWNEAMFEAKQS